MSESTFWIDPLTDHRISYDEVENRCFRFPLEVGRHNFTNLSEFFSGILAAIFQNASISLNRQGDQFEIDVQVNGKERAADVGTKSLNAGNWADKILSSSCRIGISTSGSSGRPTRIVHRMSTLTREIKHHAKHANDVWGFAYCPTHFAGMQVFLQAVVNRNSIVRLNDLPMSAAHDAIDRFEITHLSATPTYFKSLCSHECQHADVRRITMGGEPSCSVLLNRVSEIFPNAKIANVYASTEAGSLLISESDLFRVRPGHEQLICVIDGQLAIHRSLLADSVKEGFNETFFQTGDNVEVVDVQPLTFRFSSRRSDMVNVGGAKVNPHEIELLILSFPEVVDVCVYGKSNSVTGQILCCDLVFTEGCMLDAKAVRRRLEGSLESFQIPRIVNIVEELKLTESGKKFRRRD